MSFAGDDRGVSTTFGYILTVGISVIFFSLVVLTYSSILIQSPTTLAVMGQYNDVGNEVSSKIMDIYVIAPENGTLETDLRLPGELGGEGYVIEFIPAGSDQEIRVASLDGEREVHLTLNGVNHTVSLNGMIYRSGEKGGDYGIRFNSE